ncbi:MAG: hypothetical protein ABIR66_05965 [Saprospiraceae bacterium]
MFTLKPISKDSIPNAVSKAERYRLLNEPRLAESICLDILEIESNHHQALVILLLSITDQYSRSPHSDVIEARQLLPRLHNEYEQYYYGGIICERHGKAILNRDLNRADFMAYEWITEAMKLYEKAEAIRPSGNDDSILRWNTCVRLIHRNNLAPRTEEYFEPPLE